MDEARDGQISKSDDRPSRRPAPQSLSLAIGLHRYCLCSPGITQVLPVTARLYGCSLSGGPRTLAHSTLYLLRSVASSTHQTSLHPSQGRAHGSPASITHISEQSAAVRGWEVAGSVCCKKHFSGDGRRGAGGHESQQAMKKGCAIPCVHAARCTPRMKTFLCLRGTMGG
ncbi:hypothetical protein E2C01_039421 [Portunus trituberculatus]|uniref:Uncharacterized protein n=1 Tax=Portunus trituberculatus TaxID=210409 RepID=A0A5B7FJN6_PORTR|nr:hypothetical protein [Portunus trituberculatus]